MPVSPLCQVKDGAAAYVPTTNGVTVGAGDTIVIQLISVAGVGSWSISCVYTDELSNAATVTAALTIDNLNKTATFTAPGSGRSYIFQSRVNGGVDINGVVQPSYTTTFGIYTLAAGGNRVIAANETTEGNATFGWVSALNPLIRSPGGAPAATTIAQGLVQLAGDLGGLGTTASAPTVANITGDAGGYANILAANGVRDQSNAKEVEYNLPVNIITATTAATSIFTFATTTNRRYSVRGNIGVQNSPVSAYGSWDLKSEADNNAGTLTQRSATPVTNNTNNSGFVLTWAASGTNLVLTATDPVGGRRWTGRIWIAEAAF